MSPDGREQLFTITDSALWRYESMLRIRNLQHEMLIDTPPFVLDFEYKNQWFIGEPVISPDDQNLGPIRIDPHTNTIPPKKTSRTSADG